MSGVTVVKNKVTTLDKIRKYYLSGPDKVTLSEKQDEIRINVYKAWNLMINYHSREQAMKTMMNSSEVNGEAVGCSRAQAYRYVNDALTIFGDPQTNQKEAKRYLIEEDLMRLQQRAMKNGDGPLELAVIKQRIKIGGFDKDTDPKFNADKLKAQVYVLKPHPTALAFMEAARNGGSYDFNNVDAEDIPFKEVVEDEED